MAVRSLLRQRLYRHRGKVATKTHSSAFSCLPLLLLGRVLRSESSIFQEREGAIQHLRWRETIRLDVEVSVLSGVLESLT